MYSTPLALVGRFGVLYSREPWVQRQQSSGLLTRAGQRSPGGATERPMHSPPSPPPPLPHPHKNCPQVTFDLHLKGDWVLQLDASTQDKFSRHVLVHIPDCAFANNLVAGELVRAVCLRAEQQRDHDKRCAALYVQKVSWLRPLCSCYNGLGNPARTNHCFCYILFDAPVLACRTAAGCQWWTGACTRAVARSAPTCRQSMGSRWHRRCSRWTSIAWPLGPARWGAGHAMWLRVYPELWKPSSLPALTGLPATAAFPGGVHGLLSVQR